MTSDVQDKLKALAKAYAIQLPAKVEEIAILWKQVKTKQQKDDYVQLIRYTHTLCGTAGTYGHPIISEVACKLELKLRVLQQLYDIVLIKEIDELVQDLKQLILKPAETEIIPSLQISDIKREGTRLIYILGEHQENIAKQSEQARQFNYSIHLFNDIKSFMNALQDARPDMVILNIDLAETIDPGLIKQLHDEIIFIVYSSTQDDLNSRLYTVRHFGQAFVNLPLDVNNLLPLMDNLFEAEQSDYARILIVDDSTFVAEYYSMVLDQAGMLTHYISDPKEFLSVVLEFQPDLILMDVNMPFCSGTELAQVVNQQETLTSIPIIFLSTIAERAKQLEVLSVAGDDFLTKPIEPKHLLAAVRNRLMRSRMLRSRMMRDSLTNLYNHTMIHHHLERELSIAHRYQNQLSIALIDLDFFKKVNDNYGHQAGDKILKNLSVFLQKKLRKTDLIGRYGGEEFLVILPDTSAHDALALLSDICVQFAARQHQIGDKTIRVTLSGGISSYPQVNNATDLVKAADDALYEAKERGRNQIVMAEMPVNQ